MKTFAQNLAQLMPSGITLPPELLETFDWMQDQGWHHIRKNGAPEDHWLSFYPAKYIGHPTASLVTFGGTTLTHTGHWSTPDPTVDARIADIGDTSGDGARVAIWLDDTGKQQYVHIGHDSHGIITDDPLVLLQFLAMGYPEPGALDDTSLSPLQATLDYHGITSLSELAEDEQPVTPTALQEFLKARFGLAEPKTARALGIADFPKYHDTETKDPYAQWINAATPEPTEAELAYEMELMRTVESLDLNDTDSSDTIMQKIGSLFKSKE
jgi:hypothetical protein